MSSICGDKIKVTIFGESHGIAIGVVIDGLPSGEPIDIDDIMFQMGRRAPGGDSTATPRSEADVPEICSGMIGEVTTGTPLCAVIENTNVRSVDYEKLARLPRPGHADYTGYVRYSGFNDVRGGGHFSGRLTAPLTFAGAVCRQILARRGVTIGSHISSIGYIEDTPFDPINISAIQLNRLAQSYFALNAPSNEQAMRACIEDAKKNQDSVGGVIETAAIGVPAGLGSPMFGGVENVLSSIVFGVPAVKGVEFGAGFAISLMRGSEANDPFAMKDDRIITLKNNNGGILGGITDGMPIIMRCAIKPTASISQKQQTVDLKTRKDTSLTIGGRHDPCIVPRAIPGIESAMAIGLINLMAEAGKL